MSALEVPESVAHDLTSLSLDELAGRANAEHEKVGQSLTDALIHALAAGEVLLVAREQVGPRGWVKWCAENVEIADSTIGTYMRIAFYRDELGGAAGVVEAREALVGFPAVNAQGNGGHDEVVRQKARDLVGEGMTINAVSDLFGVAHTTVHSWVDPAWGKRQRKLTDAATRRARLARKALAEKQARDERDALAKSSGGASSKAYALVRKALLELDRAHGEAKTPGEREALRSAVALTHKAEDQLVRAMKEAE